MDVRVGLWRTLSAEELMLLNCGVGEDSLKSPLDCKESQPVHPRGNQSWTFNERTDAEAETPVLWPGDVKNWLIWKDLMLGKIESGRRRELQRMSWLEGITDSMDRSLSRLQEAWSAAVHGVAKSWTWLSDWTELYWEMLDCIKNSVVLVQLLLLSKWDNV